ncbi:MAG: transglutaminase domain-containing protein [Chloroflexi bacterium]|nr:transglutaminase domain-containing protein [Chloroflexota bacterium]
MRQANWNEMFAPRPASGGLVLSPEVPEEPRGWRRLFWWEDLLTLALLAIMLLAVVTSVNRANWVDEMPSLYPIALLGLLMGALLARLRWPEGLVHLLALPIGAVAALAQILAVVPGPQPVARFQELVARMDAWFGAAFTGGISNDDLPFIVLVVALAWLAAYLSSWAVFRWRNVWLALIPTGGVLLANISYLPGQFSFAFVVFLFGGALLVTRLHLMERAAAWRDESTPYPLFLSLSVLHATFWLALLLVVLAWVLPQANEASALEALWHRATTPITERVQGLSRLFVSVNNQQGTRIHRFEDILPFLGSVGELPGTLMLEVETEPLDQPRYLRAQAYYFYTPTGWRQGSVQETSLGRNEITQVDESLTDRETVTIRVIATGNTGDTIFTVGQPRRVDRPVRLEWWRVRRDVTGVEAKGGLAPGSRYESVGTISVASEEDLRAAGVDYPFWVFDRYLQLPDDFSPRVQSLARELTRLDSNPYDQALAIESYLRTIPYDLDVAAPPPGQDAVEYFLFDARRGYFDYHASAMVVMLRSAGVPARLAVGYALLPEQRDTEADRHLVTEQSAFAWPEVYFPDLGWLEFNPTPNLPTIDRFDPALIGSSSSNGAGDTPILGLGLENLPGGFPDGEGTSADDAALGTSSGDRGRWVLIGLAAGFAVILISTAGGVGYAWLRGLAGLTPTTRLWAKTVRLGGWARIPAAPDQTPSEYAAKLRAQAPGLEDVDLLAGAYVRHRFGRRQPDEQEQARLERAWRAVRGGLLRHLLRLR